MILYLGKYCVIQLRVCVLSSALSAVPIIPGKIEIQCRYGKGSRTDNLPCCLRLRRGTDSMLCILRGRYFVRVPASGRAGISQMGLCKVCAHEPEELLKALDMVLDNIRADDVKAVKLSDSFAVVLDEPLIICDQGFQIYRSVL